MLPLLRQVAAAKGLPVIDVDTPTASHPEFFLTDGVHPNDTGYALIAQVMHDGLLRPLAGGTTDGGASDARGTGGAGVDGGGADARGTGGAGMGGRGAGGTGAGGASAGVGGAGVGGAPSGGGTRWCRWWFNRRRRRHQHQPLHRNGLHVRPDRRSPA